LLLFGPVTATAHFLLVYLMAEIACAATWLQGDVLGVGSLALVVLGLTVVAAGATSAVAVVALRSRVGAHGDLAFTGFLLGVLFTVEILLVGIPPVFLDPC
jgi:hypothetical protein